jgi:hypothetical protein
METKINFTYRLVDTVNVDHDKYLSLHNSLFVGAATTSEWVLWYHNDVPKIKTYSKGTRTWGVFDGDLLIGIWSVEPKLLRVSGDILHVGRCFAVGIHAEYRRHGLFVSLSEYAIQQEKHIAEYEYILGFPQVGRTVIGGHFKAGWEEIFQINIYSRKNEPRVFGPSLSNIKLISDFSDIFKFNNIKDGITETAEYYNLRYLKHPDHQYLCYSYNNAFIVLKPYGSFCHILELSGPNEDVEYLLNVLKSLAIKHGWKEVNIWCNDDEIYKNEILSVGFESGAEFGLSVTFIAVKINSIKKLVLENSSIQMGIEEGY